MAETERYLGHCMISYTQDIIDGRSAPTRGIHQTGAYIAVMNVQRTFASCRSFIVSGL